MKITSNVQYPKFVSVGDKVEGVLMEYKEGVDGKFGPENVATLDDGNSELMVRCTSVLSRLMRENLHRMRGRWIAIELTELRPSQYGTPIKLYDIDVADEPAAAQLPPGTPVPALPPADLDVAEDDLPF